MSVQFSNMRGDNLLIWLGFCGLCFTILVLDEAACGAEAADYWYDKCAPQSCGGNGPSISFPFYIQDRQAPDCGGGPFFKPIRCGSHNVALINLSSVEYVIKDIYYENQSLRVSDEAMNWDGNISTCFRRLVNWTLNGTTRFMFHLADTQTNLSLFYGCNDTALMSGQIVCDNNTQESVLPLTKRAQNFKLAKENCNSSIVVPVDQWKDNRTIGMSDLQNALSEGFVLNYTVPDCRECQGSGGRCGTNLTTLHFKCFCPDRPHSRSCKHGNAKKSTLLLATAISGGVVILLIALLISVIISKRKERIKKAYLLSRNISKPDPDGGGTYFGIPVFSYTELKVATNNFDSSKELGDGGFGTVYHGNLQDGREVAVKRLYEHNSRRMEQYINEIKILTSLRHPNLVSLYGCTSRRSEELLLVYEYIPNGTVADHLHGEMAKISPLSWAVRMKIAIETAEALAYLHKSIIIHRDVKTDNILLDSYFCVKVADFGLSRLFPNDVTHISTAPQGTPGYVDPEYHQCYQLTDKSDVYSFGVVLIELISSMPAVDISRHKHEINLANLAVNKIQSRSFDDLIDPSLGYKSDAETERMAISVAALAFNCLQLEKDMRPSMNEVLDILKGIQSSNNESSVVKASQDIESAIDHRSISGKIPPSPETEDSVLLKNKKFQSSPNAVTDIWFSGGSTASSSLV